MLYGAYSVTVSTRVCGTLSLGSNPSRHPRGSNPVRGYNFQMQTLENLIETLRKQDNVDAVLLVGSKASGEETEYSDIDLAVVFKENTEKLFSLFQFIDNRPADIFFYDTSSLQKILNDEAIPANTMDGVLVGWLKTGNIEFDKSGVLTSLKNKSEELKNKLEVPDTEIAKWDSIINISYITNKRYFESKNPEYHEVLEIKLLQDLYNVFMGYFEFRNIPWTGEKQMLRYLKNNDIEFYNLYTSCIQTPVISDKFEKYSKLVKLAFVDGYGIWGNDVVQPTIRGALSTEEKHRLVNYWGSLSK